MDRADDAALARRAAAGDERAFEVLVRRHTGAVWRAARGVLRDGDVADDVVQETFVRAHRGLASFRGESSVRTWLLSICHRCCLEHVRRRRLALVSFDDIDDQLASEPVTVDERVVLEAAIARLGMEERVAFTLVDILGHSREDAAMVVGVPASTMRSRVARARRQLVALVSNDTNEEAR